MSNEPLAGVNGSGFIRVEMVTVSVVVPARNAAATLGKTLESLLAQTFTGWEVLIVDDMSDDGTRMIAEEFDVADRRFTVLQ